MLLVTDLFVGLYLLDQMRNQNWRITTGGYRDDFPAYTDLTNKRADKIKDDIIEFFDGFGLKIEITACNARVIDFLDVTLDLMTGSYKPYHKPMLHYFMCMLNQTIQKASSRSFQ